jgi:hypothetical protein
LVAAEHAGEQGSQPAWTRRLDQGWFAADRAGEQGGRARDPGVAAGWVKTNSVSLEVEESGGNKENNRTGTMAFSRIM